MAESYSPWRAPATLTASEVSSPILTSGSSCPIFYPVDSRALDDLANSGLPEIGVPGPYIAPGGSGIDPRTPPLSQIIGATGVAIAPEDNMRFQAWGSPQGTVVTFYGRILRPDGQVIPFSRTIATAGGDTKTSYIFQPGQGILLNIAASIPDDTSSDGLITVKAELGRGLGSGFTPHTLLLYGQVTGNAPLSGGGLQPGTTPGAGASGTGTFKEASDPGGTTFKAEVVITPSAGRAVRVTTAYANFLCSASGAFQTCFLNLIIGSIYILQTCSNRVVRSAEAGYFFATIGGGFPVSHSEAAAGTNVEVFGASLPESLWIPTAFTAQIILTQQVAADRVSDMFVAYEER